MHTCLKDNKALLRGYLHLFVRGVAKLLCSVFNNYWLKPQGCSLTSNWFPIKVYSSFIHFKVLVIVLLCGGWELVKEDRLEK